MLLEIRFSNHHSFEDMESIFMKNFQEDEAQVGDSRLQFYELQKKCSFTSQFCVLLYPQVGWELLQPSKVWGPAPLMTLEVPSFVVRENSEKPYNAYEKSDKPYSEYENFENGAGTRSEVVKTEPELADIQQSDVSAYANLTFHCESGKRPFPCENQTSS